MDAYKLKYKYIHIWVSLALFVACLAFPGYYIRESHEPQSAYALLLMGWLGPLDGHFSWYANLFYLIAIIKYKKQKASYVLGFIALLLALSFLGYSKIIVSEAPTYARITGYGWGYYLWITSLGIYSIGQFLLSYSESENIISNKKILAIQSGWISIVFIIFSGHYFIGKDSQYSIQNRRNVVFDEKCRIAEEHIYKKTNDTKGIFFDPDWGARFKEVKPGVWYNNGVGVLGLGKLNSGLIQFYEKKNTRPSNPELIDSLPFIKYMPRDHKGFETGELESEYAVITKSFDIPKALNIYGAEVLIKDLRDNTILAKSTYVFDRIGRKFCGHAPNGHFSVSKFIIDTLNLSRKYSSNYDNK